MYSHNVDKFFKWVTKWLKIFISFAHYQWDYSVSKYTWIAHFTRIDACRSCLCTRHVCLCTFVSMSLSLSLSFSVCVSVCVAEAVCKCILFRAFDVRADTFLRVHFDEFIRKTVELITTIESIIRLNYFKSIILHFPFAHWHATICSEMWSGNKHWRLVFGWLIAVFIDFPLVLLFTWKLWVKPSIMLKLESIICFNRTYTKMTAHLRLRHTQKTPYYETVFFSNHIYNAICHSAITKWT